jgi:hypothetical protein
MAYENGPRSLIDDDRDILVYIPEAAESDAERIVIVDRPLPARTPWYERNEALWVVLGIAVALIAVLALAPRSTTIDVVAAPEGDGEISTIDAGAPAWAALTIPVPESYRTHTANVSGDIDVLAVADFGPGAADIYLGSVTTGDGPLVQQVFSGQVFTIASPTGATIVAYMPYQAGVAPELGQQVTFVGTLMPVPADFATMVGSEAATIGNQTAVYVTVVPETLSIVVPVPEVT